MDFIKLLASLDSFLETREKIIICGGMAVSLAYGGKRQTVDIDVIAPVPLSQDLIRAVQQVASSEMVPGDWLNDSCKGFASYLPLGWEGRLVEVSCGLKNLELYCLGKPDLIMLKLKAARARDLEDIQFLKMSKRDVQIILKNLNRITAFDSKTALMIKLRLQEWGYV